MQRYFVQRDQIKENRIIIVGDDVHHIKRVMRFRKGTNIICADGKGNDYLTEIVELTKEAVICKIISITPSKGETKRELVLAQALPKGDKWEWILQKGTELGVTSFYPFFSARTLVKIHPEKLEKKLKRWQRIVKEAAEQAHRGVLPVIHPPLRWDSLLSLVQKQSNVLIAYEKGGRPIRACLEERQEQTSAWLIIGPEGGFAPDEIEAAKNAGAVPVTLGPRILRTETASIVGLTCILYANGELGGE